ncbi:MAG: hypothetical protein CME70_16650 [Halobacteriovorax sp.]|nr:hypothetical protein [Halobacteriovorax sp.]|tara:strand:+ start:76610 stop:77941 length:1332 start_codon:yes stop_codon:yes gene_type:complete
MNGLKREGIVQKTIICLLLAIYFFIDRRPVLIEGGLSMDELLSWTYAVNGFESFFDRWLNSSHQPMFYIILTIWNKVLGNPNDYWIRLVPLGFALIALVLYSLFSIRKNGLFLGILLSLFFIFEPLTSGLSVFLRPYSMIFCLIMANLLFLTEFKNKKLFELSVVLLLFTHTLGLIYLCILFVSLLISGFDIKGMIKEYYYLVILSLLTIALVLYQGSQEAVNLNWVGRDFSSFHLNLNIFWFFLACSGFLYKSIKKKGEERLFFVIPLVGICVFFIIDFFVMPFFVGRHFIILYPAGFLFISLGVKELIGFKYTPVLMMIIILFFKAVNGKPRTEVEQGELNYKTLFLKLKESEEISSSKRTLCLYNKSYKGLLKPYSIMYFGFDFCHTHLEVDTDNLKEAENYEYIALLDYDNVKNLKLSSNIIFRDEKGYLKIFKNDKLK